MGTAEIVEGLRRYTCRTMNPAAKQLLDAAIAALEPVPITEDRLREVGFVDAGDGDWFLSLTSMETSEGVTDCYLWAHTHESYFAVEMRRDSLLLHITSMQQLRTVIEALGGASDD